MKKAFGLGVLLLGAATASGWAGPAEDKLVDAVRANQHAAIKSLLAAHADPNLPLPDKSTVLAWAVDRQDAESVTMLLAAGAKPNVIDVSGTSPLALACELGNPDIVSSLLKAGADARTTRADGISALAMCAPGRSVWASTPSSAARAASSRPT